MKFIKGRIKGRTAFIVGTGALRTEESIEYATAARKLGADAILVATPPYSLPTGACSSEPVAVTAAAASTTPTRGTAGPKLVSTSLVAVYST